MERNRKSAGDAPPPEIQVLQGRPIWLDNTRECEILRRVCILPHAWSLLDQLSRGTLQLEDLAHLSGEESQHLRRLGDSWDEVTLGTTSDGQIGRQSYFLEESLARLDQGSGLIHLCAALKVLEDLWARDIEAKALRAVVVVPNEIGGDAEIVTNDAVLVLQPGSLKIDLGWNAAYLASKWIVGLWIRRGRVPSQIADDIVRRLRDRGLNDTRLPTTHEASREHVTQSCGVIIFLHGLMSTDVGLFDPFVDTLLADSVFQLHYRLLAFPHDTFASIASNAAVLLGHIDYLFANNTETPLTFVCHSRGGLLARKVATDLYRTNFKRWKRQLAGAVTFGTPHLGTPLAEFPSTLLGAGLAAMRTADPAGFMGASDVLALVAAYRGSIPGIDDLKPLTAISRNPGGFSFLEHLRKAEIMSGDRHGCRMPILAIGGQASDGTGVGWASNRIFRGVPNDYAVEMSSSAPERITAISPVEVESDHFSYFTRTRGFVQAVDFLKTQMNYGECEKKAPAVSSGLRKPIKASRRIELPKLERRPPPRSIE